MTDANGGLGDWTMIGIIFVAGPVASFFVADAIVTAHDLSKELVGIPAWLAMMALWIGAFMALDESVATRRAWHRDQMRQARERSDE